jgi:dephospho-CoA kinase
MSFPEDILDSNNRKYFIIVLMLLVGLTGNYGMGKSTVIPLFQEIGAATLDTDMIVRSLLEEKTVLRKIRALLGETVFYKNGRLNKKRVSDLVFKDESLRHSLEDILHPLVFERIRTQVAKSDKQDRVFIIEVPLLFERGYQSRFDKTITVFAEEELALERLEEAGIKRHEAIQRLRAQLPIEEKKKRSDFIIDNNGTIDRTTKQVKAIYRKLVKESSPWK